MVIGTANAAALVVTMNLQGFECNLLATPNGTSLLVGSGPVTRSRSGADWREAQATAVRQSITRAILTRSADAVKGVSRATDAVHPVR